MHEDNEALWRSYARHLGAKNRSAETLDSYLKALRELDAFLDRDVTTATKQDIQTYITERLKQISATTVAIRYRSLRAFFNWCVSVEEIMAVSPMKGMGEPKVTDKPPPVLHAVDIEKLMKTCDGREYEQLRDSAILRIWLEAGSPRLAEMTNLALTSVDMSKLGMETITLHGKGDKIRTIPIGAKTCTALERYMRARKKHKMAKGHDALWIGVKGPMTMSGIAQILARKSKQAGLARIHPHQLRHTSYHMFAEEGGNDGDAMQLFGWSSSEMPRRYGRSAAVSRAHRVARKNSQADRF